MSEADPEPARRRRPRYRGTHPRRFEEKYKEHDPQRYAEDVAKVLAAGRTPAGSHRPILLAEVIAALAPRPGQVLVDCTLGYGGHARALLELLVKNGGSGPPGRLLGLDADPIELQRTRERLAALGYGPPVFEARRSNFAGLPQVLAELGIAGVDGLLADLGVSSMQLDDPQRGFSFKLDGPLDLRLNPSRAPSGAQWLAKVSQRELAGALKDHADEPEADLLAAGLLRWREQRPIARTTELALAVRTILAQQRPRLEPERVELTVRRCFQALRIAVNDELGALDRLLEALPACLLPGGRAVLLSFHSGEDRRIKQAFRKGLQTGLYRAISADVQRPSAAEQRDNPRSKSAKLRWAIRSDRAL
jgi:16S rRNA (cytosine1402-N4)-methyltransferase